MTINSEYLNSNFGKEATNVNYIGSIDPNTGAPLLDGVSSTAVGINGSLYDLISAQFLQTGVSKALANTYAAFVIEATELTDLDYSAFFDVNEFDQIELSALGYTYINALRDNTSKIGIKTESEFNNLVKQSIRI